MTFTVKANANIVLETTIEAKSLSEAKLKAKELNIYDFNEVEAELLEKKIEN